MRQQAMRQQAGFTLGSVFMFMLVAGWCAYTAFRIVPGYIDYFLVKDSLEKIANNPDNLKASTGEVRLHLAKELEINNVKVIGQQDVEIENVPNGIKLSVDFSTKVHYVGPISLTMDFNAVGETR